MQAGQLDSPYTLYRYMHHAQAGDLDRVSQLLAQHHDVNAADYEGLTPLHAAAGLNHAPIARLLLERGAATDVTTHVGTLPRTVAISEQVGGGWL